MVWDRLGRNEVGDLSNIVWGRLELGLGCHFLCEIKGRNLVGDLVNMVWNWNRLVRHLLGEVKVSWVVRTHSEVSTLVLIWPLLWMLEFGMENLLRLLREQDDLDQTLS